MTERNTLQCDAPNCNQTQPKHVAQNWLEVNRAGLEVREVGVPPTAFPLHFCEWDCLAHAAGAPEEVAHDG